MSLGISTNLEALTAQYLDVRLERKKSVLENYHRALHPQNSVLKNDADQKEVAKWNYNGAIIAIAPFQGCVKDLRVEICIANITRPLTGSYNRNIFL